MLYFGILGPLTLLSFILCVSVCLCAYEYVDMCMFVHAYWDREGSWFYDLSLSSLFLKM